MRRNDLIIVTILVLLSGLTAVTCLTSGCPAGVRSAGDENVSAGTITLPSPDSGAYWIYGDDENIGLSCQS